MLLMACESRSIITICDKDAERFAEDKLDVLADEIGMNNGMYKFVYYYIISIIIMVRVLLSLLNLYIYYILN